MTCTLATLVALLGPIQPGQVVTVPAGLVAQATPTQVALAKACARRLGVKLRAGP